MVVNTFLQTWWHLVHNPTCLLSIHTFKIICGVCVCDFFYYRRQLYKFMDIFLSGYLRLPLNIVANRCIFRRLHKSTTESKFVTLPHFFNLAWYFLVIPYSKRNSVIYRHFLLEFTAEILVFREVYRRGLSCALIIHTSCMGVIK